MVVNKLLQEHQFALFVFSTEDRKRWHFVNVKYDPERDGDGRKRYLLLAPPYCHWS